MARAIETAHGPIREALAKRAREIRVSAILPTAAASVPSDASAKQGAVSRLVQVYSNRGHLLADIDPLGLMQRPVPEVLELRHFGLSEADLDTEFYTGSRVDAIPKRMKLRDMIAQLRHIYCGTDRRRIRARVRLERAHLVAESLPGRPHLRSLQRWRSARRSCGISPPPKDSSSISRRSIRRRSASRSKAATR